MNALLGILCFSSLFFRRFITGADWAIAGGGAERPQAARREQSAGEVLLPRRSVHGGFWREAPKFRAAPFSTSLFCARE